MNLKNALISCALCGLIGVGVGRYSAPTKTLTESSKTQQNTIDDHKVVTETQDKKPNGEILTTITISHDVDKTQENSQKNEKIVEHEAPRWTISALAGLQVGGSPMYGSAVNYRILGPIGIGAFGLVPQAPSKGAGPLGGVSLSISF